MQQTMMRVARYTHILSRAGLWFAGAGVVLMTAIIFAQVFVRYVLNSSLPWSEPSAVMIMGWFIFVGAAVGVRQGYHLAFDVLLYFVPDRVKLIFNSISDVVTLAFGFGMVWYGTQLAAKTANNIMPSLGISGIFDFLPLTVGGILMMLFTIERLARRAAGLPTARFGEDADPDGGPVAASEGN